MDIRKKLISIVGVLALTMSMGAGVALAQDEATESSSNVTVTVVCGATNAGITTYSLGTSSVGGSVDFADYDPSLPGTTSSTAEKALRLSMDIAPCEADGWSFSASITDFHHSTSAATISGDQFSLPAGEPNASEIAESSGGPVPGVLGPVNNVAFTTDGGPDVWNGSESIASHDGVSDVSGEMYLDYTGLLSGLNDTLEPGTYTAQITVTFSGDQP